MLNNTTSHQLSNELDSSQAQPRQTLSETPAPSDTLAFTVMVDDGGLLSKRVSLDDSGKPVFDSTGCSMVRGTAYTCTLEGGLRDLPDVLNRLQVSQALCLGVAKQQQARVVTRKSLPWNPGCIARTQDHFPWPEKGIMGFVDFDPSAYGPKVRDAAHLIEIFASVDPQWRNVEYVWTFSTSAGLWVDGTPSSFESNGIHLFLKTKGNPESIARYFKRLEKKLWLAGYGFILISKSGSFLVRSVIDTSVLDPSRLIFEGGILIDDRRIQQYRPGAEHIEQGGAALDTEALFLTPREEADYRKRVSEAKSALEPQRARIREAYRAERIEEIRRQQEVSKSEATRIVDAFDRNILLPSTPLLFDGWVDPQGNPSGPALFTVRDVLTQPDQFDGLTLADPLEPGYGGGRNKGICRVSEGAVTIYSHAHGGRLFHLKHDYQSLVAALEAMTDDDCADRWATIAARTDLTPTDKDRLAKVLKDRIGLTKKAFEDHLRSEAALLGEAEPSTHNDYAEAFLEQHLRQEYPDGIVSSGKRLYVAHGGIWRPVEHEPLTIPLGEMFRGDLCRRVSDYRAIIDHSMIHIDKGPDFFVDPNIPFGVCTPNGFYRIDHNTGDIIIEPVDLYVHRSQYMTNAVPALVETPYLNQWLNTSIVGEDAEPQRALIQEIVGAALFGLMARYKKSTLLHGETDSGKSMVQKLLQELFPEYLKGSVKPSDWSNEQHLIKLVNIRLNICGDMPSSRVLEGDMFKMVTGGDSFSGKEVYQKVRDNIRSIAAHIFSANEFPAVKADDVFFNRWLIVHFPVTIQPQNQILDLEKIISARETAGLLHWAMLGAQRVVKNKGFSLTATHHRLLEHWKIQANSALCFLDDKDAVVFTNDFNDYVLRSSLYSRYQRWCTFNNNNNFLGKKKAQRVFDSRLTRGTTKNGVEIYRYIRELNEFG